MELNTRKYICTLILLTVSIYQIDSFTPLMMICKQTTKSDDVLAVTKFLLEQGAVVNVRDQRGYTPFMYACTSGNTDIIELLLNLSAIDACDNFGNTVMIDSFLH